MQPALISNATRDCFFKSQPGSEAFGLVTGQDGVAVTVFKRFNRNGNVITDVDFKFANVVFEFFDRNERFGFQAGVNDDKVVVDTDDFSRNDFAGTHVVTGE